MSIKHSLVLILFNLWFQKLAVGGFPEKILSAFQSVFEVSSTEDAALSNCNNAAQNMCKIGEEAENSLVQGKGLFVALLFIFFSFSLG